MIVSTGGAFHLRCSIRAVPVAVPVAVPDAVTRLGVPVGMCHSLILAEKVRFVPVKQPGQTNQPCRVRPTDKDGSGLKMPPASNEAGDFRVKWDNVNCLQPGGRAFRISGQNFYQHQ